MQKRLKTPLRYPGGKSKAIHKIVPHFPKTITEYREPFLGGGSIAIEVARHHPDISIWVNDLYWPLYNFWIHLRDNGDALSDELKRLKLEHNDHDTGRILFNDHKIKLNDTNRTNFDRAVSFWIVNKCSFSGLTESSTFSKWASDKNFNMSGIEALKEYSKHIQTWKITNLSYENLLTTNTKAFIYLDPPYEIASKLYGKRGSMHRGFDHDQFAADCNNVKSIHDMAISYNSDQSIRERFPDWKQIEFDLTYFLRTDRKNYRNNQPDRKELLLINY